MPNWLSEISVYFHNLQNQLFRTQYSTTMNVEKYLIDSIVIQNKIELGSYKLIVHRWFTEIV